MSIFEFFFKYKPVIYQKGHLAFQLLGSRWWFILFILAAGAGAYYAYKNVAPDKYSTGLVVLRALTFTVLAFIFLRPVLNISTVLPQESYMAVVIDNSESMKIKDDGQVSRGDQLLKQFETTNFFKRLNDKFKVRIYRFDRDAERIERTDRLTFAGKRTRLESATDLLNQELGTVPLSGVVLITDGGDNASKQWTESLSRLESRKIPFYTVGVGSENITHDAEIVKVTAPRETLKESTAVVDVSYRSHGFAGRKATLYVRENGVLLKSEEVTLPADGQISEKTIDLPVKNEGTRLFSFSLQAPDDRIPENNTLDSLVEIKNDHPQILYIEGEPRWEFKFLRRAIGRSEYPACHTVALIPEQVLPPGHRQRRDACRRFSEEARRALPIQGPHLRKYRVHILHTGSVEERCGLRQHARRRIPDDGWPQLVCRREVSEQPDRRYSPRANGDGRPHSYYRPSQTCHHRLRAHASIDETFTGRQRQHQAMVRSAPAERLQQDARRKSRRNCSCARPVGSERQRRSDPAGLPAIRPRPNDGVHQWKQLAMADGNGSRGHDV